ncbi:hypothetical protein [Rhodococcus phage REQ1]|uniref:hypothetical protein n=1 Tax=Rhodococcus phage REQ1 TaxID=1109712 RepID=UPI00023EEC57|nr:hypothetical protein RoPhREQ1_gp53 [Rhodococcus phage REQ1]AEV52049.1 hypothetical protein [Rhodococcus phage REQ1]
MSDSGITQDVVTRAPFPLTVGSILDFAENLKDRPRDERVDHVKMGALSASYLRHRRPATELPPTSVPPSVDPRDVHKLHVSLVASEALRLAREGHDVLGVFTTEQAMHGWADYEIRALAEHGGTDFCVNQGSPRYWTVVFTDPVSLEATGMAAFVVAGATHVGQYDKVLTDARVPSLP